MKKTACIAILVLLSACSGLKFMYGFADTLLRDRAETYLDLTADDERHLDAEIDSLLVWHRLRMLPKYAVFLEARAQEAETASWTQAGLSRSAAGLRGLIRQTVTGAAPHIGSVLARQTGPEKVAYLRERMAENLAEARERAGRTRAERLDALTDRRVNNFERFTGPLSDDQVRIIRMYSETDLDGWAQWLTYRGKRHAALVDFLATEPDAAATAAFVEQLLNRAEEIVGTPYKTRADAWWSKQVRMTFEVLTSLNSEQRKHLADSLRGYAVDMTELADAS